jgi:hypothetical protein
VAVTSSDLDSEFVRLPGAVGDLMRAIDPRTLGAVNHMMAESLNQGKTIEQAIKYVIDEAYNRFCQIVPSRERGH